MHSVGDGVAVTLRLGVAIYVVFVSEWYTKLEEGKRYIYQHRQKLMYSKTAGRTWVAYAQRQ
jgi:hypothetical protein